MKKNIAILIGGFSSEFDISVKSGTVVSKNLDRSRFTPYLIYIEKSGWYYKNEEDKTFLIDKNDFSITMDSQKIQFDLVFNAIHGSPGEDGQILAYLELLGIPHTSAPFYQMALTFNKKDCLAVAKKHGIPTAKSFYINKGDSIDIEAISASLDFPVFVKPNQAGSSFGISKVYEKTNLEQAIYTAKKEDEEVLIEQALDGIEVSVGVLSTPRGPMVLPITEIVSENDFFDYEAKYKGASQEITPARISEIQQKNVEQIALDLYRKIGMSGFSRSEFILVGDIPHFLEMNTVPGLTEESILPQQAAKAGMSLEELFNLAINQAQ